ncbi:MAG: methionine--tRNA ligase, partial [Pyrinomonadaceae bacterium]
QQQVDDVSEKYKKMFADFGLTDYDIFMRTTKPFHYEAVQNLWRAIAENVTPKGNETIYKGFYEAWFCPNCAEFKTESEYELREGEDAPRCLIHERTLDKVSEESYFFRLSDYDEILLETIEKNPAIIRPEARRNEVVSFIKSGLQDLSISREKKSVSWGVPVPNDENHVMYVWLDALSNYITAIGYGNSEKSGFEKYWREATHLVGKDILRFHTIYWWSFLLAAGIELPKQVFAHGMWLDADGRKMGKTLGNVIELDVLKKHFSIDAVRYFVLRDMVFGQDGKFGYENLIDRANADLASGLGNLSSRTLSMITKYRSGAIPNGKIAESNYLNAKRAGINPDEQELVSVLEHARDEYIRRFDVYEFSQGLETIWSVIARIDKMISDAKPWELVKDENQAETLNAVLYRATETLRWLCVLLFPVMPEATGKIHTQIGLSEDIAVSNPENLTWGELPAGTKIGETEAVFPRIDKNKVMNEIEESRVESRESGVEKQKTTDINLAGNAIAQNPTDVLINNPETATNEVENFITIDDFLKIELRVGEIKVAERIPKADKLLRFEIDLGEEKPRQILAGLAEYYEPETLIGRKVVVVANLKPRKMRGLESQGMICAASLEDGTGEKPALAAFIENVDIGARLK